MTTKSTMARTSARARSLGRPAPGTRGKNRLNGLPWILPAFIFVAGLIYYSVGYTVYISTLDWDGLSPQAQAVGLGNLSLIHI